MKNLSEHKKLLVAESNLNREVLSGEIDLIKAEYRSFVSNAATTGTLLSMITMLVSGFKKASGGLSEEPSGKASWFSRVFTVVGGARAIWGSLRPRKKG